MVSYQVFESNTTKTEIMVLVSTLDIVSLKTVTCMIFIIMYFSMSQKKKIHNSKCKLRSYKL